MTSSFTTEIWLARPVLVNIWAALMTWPDAIASGVR